MNKKSIYGESCQSTIRVTAMVSKFGTNGNDGVEHLKYIFSSLALKILGLTDAMLPVEPQDRVLVDYLSKCRNSRMPSIVVSLLMQILDVVSKGS